VSPGAAGLPARTLFFLPACGKISKMPRLRNFLLALLLGLAAGFVYGWLVNPVEFVDTTPEFLNTDYRTDIVLMTAEIYASSGDLNSASLTLGYLFPQTPVLSVSDALVYAQASGYTQPDLALLQNLYTVLQASQPGVSP
jgi:hypothetical protein